MTLQYRIAVAKISKTKSEEIVVGPDDADVVISVAKADCALEPTVAYMRGRLKAAGHTGKLFEALKSGEVARALEPFAQSATPED